MEKWIKTTKLALASMVIGLATVAAAGATDRLNVLLPDGTKAHMYPTVALDAQIRSEGGRNLSAVTYHGGRIMQSVNIYAIFWVPPHLHNGGATSMPLDYRTVINRMLANYAGHAIANINTQYYEIVSGVTHYHSGLGSYAGAYIDTAVPPANGCFDSATPTACLSDAQIRAEVVKVMALKGWTPGFNKIYQVYTPSGQGSCLSGTACAYTFYCAYHSYFGAATNPTIYSNEPYGNNSVCQTSSVATLPNPGVSDSAATAARHEISEATTDPQLNAWWDSTSGSGEETSDKCNMNYGPRTWAAGKANYNWGGFPFLLQMEYSNHTHTCVQQGP